MKQVFESKWTEKVRSIKLNRLQQEGEGERRAWYLEPAYFFPETMRQFILERFILCGEKRGCRQSFLCKLDLSHWCQVAQEGLTSSPTKRLYSW